MTGRPAPHPPNPALSFLAGFAPWIAYFAMVGNVPFGVAVLTGLGITVAVAVLTLLRGGRPKVLEVGTAVVFACFAVLAATADESFIERWIQPLSNGGLLAIVVASIALGRPFTLQYAEEQVDPELWDEPGFLYVNRLITWVWAAALAIGTAASAVPPLVDGTATLADADDALSIICYWVVPFGALAAAMVFTVRFPDWFTAAAGADDQGVTVADPPAAAASSPGPDLASAGDLELSAAPIDGGVEEAPAVAVTGAEPGATVEVVAETVDAAGHRWRSRASVVADDGGEADLATAPPVDGTWASPDPGALVWSMRFASEGTTPDLFLPPTDPAPVVIEATCGSARLRRTLVRHLVAPSVTVQEIREPLLAGRLFLPEEPTGAGVVLLPGSEGGLDSMTSNAAVLAAHGHPALVAATFRGDGPPLTDDLPETLQRVPLERLAHAITWLSQHTSSGPVSALGHSRGAEALLATAARVPDLPLGRLVLIAPSSVTWNGLGPQGSTPGVPAWTIGGDDLPGLEPRDDAVLAEMARTALRRRGRAAGAHPDVLHLVRAHGPALNGPDAAACAIEAERVDAPLLVLAGAADAVWPSVRMADAIAGRRGDAGAGDEHHHYPDAGHLIRLGLWPTDVPWTDGIALGGTPPGLAAAQADATTRVLAFLAD